MKNNDILRSVFLIFCLLASLQSFAAEWSIGIYAGISPLELAPIPSTPNPVLTAHDILDTQANFVADPFLLPVDDTWYLFFEVLNTATNQGDIGYATSNNGLNWNYQQIVLDEPYHLSYPYVFEWQGDYYMVPESSEVNSILLYRAVNFPTDWEFVATLLTGRAYVDPSPFYYNGSWWMYAGGGLDTLYLFFADHLAGPWFEHPQSPVVTGDANIARPGGRVVQFDNRLLRITQDDAPTYGNQVRAFEVTLLSRTYYAEFEVPESPLLSATGYGWNGDGIHHLDPLLLPSGTWFAVADGFGDPQQRQSIAKDNWTLLYVDSEEVIGEDGAAINAFDDDMDTFWHTEWLSAAPPHPHEIQLCLGGAYDIDGFGYVPRQDGGVNGRIADYEFFASSDGVNWGAPVATGTFANDASIKEVEFAPVPGQFVRLRALSEVNGNPWTSLAELHVFATPHDTPPTPTEELVDLSGAVQDAGGTGLCAMVLASGQFEFSCNPDGPFSLTDLPRENDGTVKRQVYVDGFFPNIDVLPDSVSETVVMTPAGACPSYNLPSDPGVFPDSAGQRINISGSVLLQDTQTPICAMVLANGQFMFSCDGSGSYALNIPLDNNGQFKLQVYADGFAPTIQSFDEFSATNDVRMARAVECQ